MMQGEWFDGQREGHNRLLEHLQEAWGNVLQNEWNFEDFNNWFNKLKEM